MDERFFILPLNYDFFVTDMKQELNPFIISDVKYHDVVQWFENHIGTDDIVLSSVSLSDDETLFCAYMESPKYEYGFYISALSRKDIYNILKFLAINNLGDV